MGAIYNLLDKFRLQSYYKRFLDIGVTDERDFIDSLTEEDLDQLGKTSQYYKQLTMLRPLNPNCKSYKEYMSRYTTVQQCTV